MARLVVNPGSPVAWEIELKPGTNLLGRGFANDFKLTDPSVSGSHCEIVVQDGQVVIKDLGSTNGTYVNRAPVKEALLQGDETVHLGGVELAFFSDAPAAQAGVSLAAPPPTLSVVPPPLPPISPSAAPRAVAPATSARPAAPISIARALTPAPPPPAAVPLPAPAAPAGAPPMVSGSSKCKFHPTTPARYYSNQCRRFFCELCVTTRTIADVQHKTCRQCGVEVAPVQVRLDRPDQVGFFTRLPSSFGYPFKGSGVFVLIVCTIVTFGLSRLGGGLLSIFATIAYYGYLFAFMQNIIHSTASEDEELPGWPGIDDLGGCFLRFAGAAVISFGVPITLAVMAIFSEESTIGSTLLIPSWV